MNKLLIAIIAIVLIGGGVYWVLNQEPTPPQVPDDCVDRTGQDVTITYTAERFFDPICAIVSSGFTITWQNDSTFDLEVGADPHPIHSGNREVSDGEFVLHVAPGQSAQATLEKVGAFGYHDHIYSSAVGILVVE